ncbi:MAG: tetratricopeptide repeat protein, partial [Ignavibacteria bacterium]|nr:tetratricopeptide repeat protein [Ignavibacteria bacterium]
MKRNNVNKTTISNCSIELALLISFLILLPGQMIAQQKRGADERFKEARELAFSGDRSAAIDSCKSLLIDHPNYTDVRVFMARVMIWEKNYDESIKDLKLVLREKRKHIQAYNTIIDAYRWSGDLENALHYNDIALGYHDEYEDFYIKKAKILLQLDRPDISAVMIWRLLKLYPGSVEGNIMKQSISGIAIFNKVKLQYRINTFPDTAPWHLS